jgi:hypothetical protein
VVAIAPGASIVAGVLLLIPAFEMIVRLPTLPAPACHVSVADTPTRRFGAASRADTKIS